MGTKKKIVERYLACVERCALDPTAVAELLDPDYLQWELPNQLNKHGQQSDLADTLRRLEMAKKMLRSQAYKVSSMTEEGDRVVIEAEWTGVIAVDAGPLKAGQTMRAFFCMVFEFRDGKIHRIRNYDCFESF